MDVIRGSSTINGSKCLWSFGCFAVECLCHQCLVFAVVDGVVDDDDDGEAMLMTYR